MTDQYGGPPLFGVGITSRDGAINVAFSGDLDVSTAPAIREAFLDPGVADASTLHVDLRDATFLDSAALGLIVTVCRRAREAGNAFGVICGNGSVRRVIAISGLIEYLQVEGPR